MKQVIDNKGAAKLSSDEALQQIDDAMAQKTGRQRQQTGKKMKRPANAMAHEDLVEVPVKLSHESSREQWLVRIQGHSSKVFKYGEGGNVDGAKRKAEAHIRSQCQQLGIQLPWGFKS